MHRNSICVNDLLENHCEFIRFDVGGWLDAMIFKPLQICRTVTRETCSELLFCFTRAPKIANVGSLALPHQIHTVVDSLFLGNKPFIHLQAACGCLLSTAVSSRDLIDLDEIVLKLLFGCQSKGSRFLDISLNLFHL